MAEEKQSTAAEPKPVNLGNWISRAWDMVTADLGTFIVLGLVYGVIITISTAIAIGPIILVGPMTVGVFYVIFQKMRGQKMNIGDIAKGFNFFVAAFLSSLLIMVFSTIGYALCIIPGIIVTGLYLFTPALIVEKNLDFWEAMEASRKLVQPHLFEMSIFVILLGLINLAGIIACGVGVFFTMPLTFAAMAIAYDDLVGVEKPTA